jgi:alkyldihydroxyacetonephosphate synthase
MPGTAAGPGLRSLLVGSEGTLGVITEVALQLSKAPAAAVDKAWIVSGFEHGRELMRAMEQAGCAPTVARLSDEEETAVSLALSGSSLSRRAFARYALSKGRGRPCLLITCFEGERGQVTAVHADASAILRSGGAKSLGGIPARAWRHGRYDGPYLRDVLMGRGLLVDTLETAAPWSKLEGLYSSVSNSLRGALGRFGGDPIVMCHVSHLYPGGASLYFTFVGIQAGEQPEERISKWWEVKSAACEAISREGGTITHHHAVGTDHRAWMEAEVGERSLAALAALKRELDPNGIMNPRKLLPDAV